MVRLDRSLHFGADFFSYSGHGGDRIGGPGDLPADDQVIGTTANGIRRSGDTLLIALRGTARSNSRSHQNRVRTGEVSYCAGFERRSHYAIHSDFARLCNAL